MRKKKNKKKVKKQYHLAVDFGEPDELKNIVILTTPRNGEGLMEILTRQRNNLFEWQEELMSRIIEDRGPVFRPERAYARGFFNLQEFEQNPCPQPCERSVESIMDRVAEFNAEVGKGLGLTNCAGCGHFIDAPENFPKGFPKERMLCCGCTFAYYWAKGMDTDNVGRNLGGYARNPSFCNSKWIKFGDKIEKAMRIQ